MTALLVLAAALLMAVGTVTTYRWFVAEWRAISEGFDALNNHPD